MRGPLLEKRAKLSGDGLVDEDTFGRKTNLTVVEESCKVKF